MHISIRRYKTKAGEAGNVVRRAQQDFVPIISKHKGYKAYYTVHAGPDSVASISIFDTKAEADESNQLAADWVKQNLASLIVGAPEITSGEGSAHHAP